MQKKNLVSKGKWVDLLIFVLFLNVFFFHSFGTAALVLFLSGSYLLAVRLFGKAEPATSILFGASILTMFVVGSPEKTLLLVFLAIGLILTGVYQGMKGGRIGGILELGLSSLIVIREYLRSGLSMLGAVMRGSMRDMFKGEPRLAPTGFNGRSPWVKSIFVGILVGLPLVAWLVMTLSKADPVFAVFIKNLVSEEFLRQLPARLGLSFLALLTLLPLLIMKWREYVSPLGWMTKVRFGREMSIVLLMVVLVMGAFLVVQWPYVFASVAKETDLSKYGVATYSEYVQRGFWDLLKVAAMVFGVSWITLLISKNQKSGERKILLVMQAILASEFVVFIVSIFRRVWLYQSYHGLTLARLYGLVLLIWLVGMMITMGLRYLYQNVRWVKVEIGWMMIVLFGSILINMESLIIKDPPTVNGRVDYVYLSRLSGDGKEGWKQAYAWASKVLEEQSNAENPNGHMKFVDRDARRDIFYAGLITRELTRNYHMLILQYGSDEEVRDYFRAVIKTRLEIAEMMPMDGMISDSLQKIRKLQTDLDRDDWLDKVDIIPTPRTAPTWDYSFPNYKAHQSDPYFYIQELHDTKRLTGLDYVLAYDPKSSRVYNWMKQEIKYAALLQMQVQDFSLQRRITTVQSESDRDYDIDISLDSPFLR